VRYRVIINNIHLYTNTASIKRGIGDCTYINTALQLALIRLGKHRSVATTIKLYDSKIKAVNYDIQIDRI